MFTTRSIFVRLVLCFGLLLTAFCIPWLSKGQAASWEARPLAGAGGWNPGLDDTPLTMAMASGDFNGDTFRDIALVNRSANVVMVYLNNQDGTFADPVSYALGDSRGPVAIAAGDFNNDDIIDLVVANADSNTLSILQGNGVGTIGDGTFRLVNTLTVGNAPTALYVADFNDDDYEDIVVANSGSNDVSVLLGNGNFTFRPRVDYPVGTNPVALTVEDFNHDDFPDIAVANAGSGTVSVLLNQVVAEMPTGRFGPPIHTTVMSGVGLILAAEFTMLNKEDLLVASPTSNTATILFGNDDGTFRTGPTLTVGGNVTAIEAEALRAGSLVQDIIVASANANTVTVFLGTGTGQFSDPTTYDVPNGPSTLDGHDYINHAISDIAVATADNAVRVLIGNGDGTLIN